MDLGPLRRLALDLNWSAFGVDAVLKRPDDDQFRPARLVWATPQTEARPTGLELQKVGTRRVAAFRKSEVDAVPRGTRIAAPTHASSTVLAWRVTDTDHVEEEHVRVVVAREPDLDDEAPLWQPPAA